MKRIVTILDMAESINKSCQAKEYFWACGLIKETLRLWRYETTIALLCDEAKLMAAHYKGGNENEL